MNTGDDRRGTDRVLWKLDLGLYHIEQQQELKFSLHREVIRKISV